MTDLTIAGVGVEYAAATGRPVFARGTETEIELLIEDRTAYEALRSYLDIDPDNAVRRGVSDRGLPWFRERVPAIASVSTFLVDVETSDNLDWPEVWALIVGGSDETPLAGEAVVYRLNLTLFVLAPLDEHDSPSSVRSAYGDDIDEPPIGPPTPGEAQFDVEISDQRFVDATGANYQVTIDSVEEIESGFGVEITGQQFTDQ